MPYRLARLRLAVRTDLRSLAAVVVLAAIATAAAGQQTPEATELAVAQAAAAAFLGVGPGQRLHFERFASAHGADYDFWLAESDRFPDCTIRMPGAVLLGGRPRPAYRTRVVPAPGELLSATGAREAAREFVNARLHLDVAGLHAETLPDEDDPELETRTVEWSIWDGTVRTQGFVKVSVECDSGRICYHRYQPDPVTVDPVPELTEAEACMLAADTANRRFGTAPEVPRGAVWRVVERHLAAVQIARDRDKEVAQRLVWTVSCHLVVPNGQLPASAERQRISVLIDAHRPCAVLDVTPYEAGPRPSRPPMPVEPVEWPAHEQIARSGQPLARLAVPRLRAGIEAILAPRWRPPGSALYWRDLEAELTYVYYDVDGLSIQIRLVEDDRRMPVDVRIESHRADPPFPLAAGVGEREQMEELRATLLDAGFVGVTARAQPVARFRLTSNQRALAGGAVVAQYMLRVPSGTVEAWRVTTAESVVIRFATVCPPP